jgi:ATP-dependent Clp protease ATP-binding subunit ClpA
VELYSQESSPEVWLHNHAVTVLDELEKATPSLFGILLSIMEDGKCTLGNNTTVDLSQAIIIATVNSGSTLAQKAEKCGEHIGFAQGEPATESIILREIKAEFTPEFLNRVDKIIIFRPLSKGDRYEIMRLNLRALQQRITDSKTPFLLSFTPECLEALHEASYDPEYGARSIRRIIYQRMLVPISRLVSSRQIQKADVIFVGWTGTEFSFAKEVLSVSETFAKNCAAKMATYGEIEDLPFRKVFEPGPDIPESQIAGLDAGTQNATSPGEDFLDGRPYDPEYDCRTN